jgi:translation initiation factor 2 subunit 1
MLYQKSGFPEESEVVLCTVTKILPHSVFVNLDDYKKSGMIHISEISPGRIRNLNDYVTVSKKIVCKVLAIRVDKGHIDLSLRRVSEGQRREKVNQLKKEQKAEKLIDMLAKDLKADVKKLYVQISKPILEEYEYVHEGFEDIVNEELDIATLKLDAKMQKDLHELIKQRMVPPEVTIEGNLTLRSYAPDGLELIKDAIRNIQDDAIILRYLGAGRYKVLIKGKEYEIIEKIFEDKIVKAVDSFQKIGGESSFARL